MDKKYNMSFTTGGLFYTESLKALEVYQEEQDWSETRKRILTENLIQARTQSTATRRVREICFRLEKLTDQQLQLLTTGAAQEQLYLLWVAVCKHHLLISDFVIKVLREKFLRMDFLLEPADYDIFFQEMAEWHNELEQLTSKIPLNEITLTCNPHYRYGGNKSEEELETLLLADTMKEFISYSVGCMFGRYSLDKPGLILANHGETVQDYLSQIPKPTFEPDDDNIIPILDGEWFIDDIAGRFRRFLKITFGSDHYEENLKFLEKAISKDIRKYFLKDFYTDHVKRYKKRPIYWLFSSPKGGFNALIYMHRYCQDTVSIVLNDYLREFRTKLISRREHLEAISISASASKTEKTKALKEIEKLKKTITELDDYERDTLYPIATQKIEIDLDDGVKVNYPKFGKALKKCQG